MHYVKSQKKLIIIKKDDKYFRDAIGPPGQHVLYKKKLYSPKKYKMKWKSFYIKVW